MTRTAVALVVYGLNLPGRPTIPDLAHTAEAVMPTGAECMEAGEPREGRWVVREIPDDTIPVEGLRMLLSGSRVVVPCGTDWPGGADDAALIERSLDEPEWFAGIFDRYFDGIHRYVGLRLGVAAADDIAAETFLVAFRKRRRYDLARREARAWLYGIATNLVGRHRRDEVRMYRALARAGVDDVVDCDEDRVAARVSAQRIQHQLAAALARLPAGDREVLLLVAWGELRYEEVAVAVDIPVGTVASRLNRARRKVREALGGVDPTLDQEDRRHG